MPVRFGEGQMVQNEQTDVSSRGPGQEKFIILVSAPTIIRITWGLRRVAAAL